MQSNELPSSGNLLFVEEIYADYQRDPESVPQAWRRYFESLAPQGASNEGGSTASSHIIRI